MLLEFDEIRHLPEQTPRVESGPIQFGDDWPGTFIRGDHAFAYSMALVNVLALLDQADSLDAVNTLMLRGLADILHASDMTRRSPTGDSDA